MSDIICARCGEPWDSTGGIHHSHSDLDVIRYEYLVDGRGCPCCCGDPMNHPGFAETVELGGDEDAMKAEAVQRWRHSVEALSEGEDKYLHETYQQEPLPPLKDPGKYQEIDAVFEELPLDDPLWMPWDA